MQVTVVVNGDRFELDLEVRRTLADALRETPGATGVPVACADGTCGSCSVLVDDEITRSCLMLAVQCDGAVVRTVDGLAPDHPARAALSAENGSQRRNE